MSSIQGISIVNGVASVTFNKQTKSIDLQQYVNDHKKFTIAQFEGYAHTFLDSQLPEGVLFAIHIYRLSPLDFNWIFYDNSITLDSNWWVKS